MVQLGPLRTAISTRLYFAARGKPVNAGHRAQPDGEFLVRALAATLNLILH